jgi:ribulose-5-phosphate 4-epimerase/fuculose-1-phosphate aldolase
VDQFLRGHGEGRKARKVAAGTEALGQAAAKALQEHKGALIRGHGVVARGDSVEEAYAILALIEQACHIRYHLALAQAFTRQLADRRP